MEFNIQPICQHATWIVNDFLELPQKDYSYLESPEFFFSGDRYCFRVYPKVNRSNGGRTEFHVRRLSVNVLKFNVSCKLAIRVRDSNGDDCYSYASKAFEENFSYPRSLIEEDRDLYVPDGSFTIECCFRLSEDSRAGSSAQEEEHQGRFPGHSVPFSPQCSPRKMELSVEYPCTHVQLTVRDFFYRSREMYNILISPEFRFAGDTYRFRLRANGDTADTDLELVRLTFSSPERTVSYTVGYEMSGYQKYTKNSRSLVGSIGLCITLSELIMEIDKYIRAGFIRLEIFLAEQSSAGAGKSVAVQNWTGLSGIRKLQSDYRQLLQKGTESDACVVVQGTEFKVHKNVLRARSTVFEAMFGHDTVEKESGRVVIDDLDPDVFGCFLEYLYTGDVQDKISDDNAFGLYVAADKYDVSTLKSECVEHMRRTLSMDSFCDVVTLALRQNEEGLLQQSIRFFKDNMQEIIITAKWQQFICENPTSANELFIKAIVPGKQ